MTQPSSSDSPSSGGRARVQLHLEIEEVPGRWRMEEERVPQSPLHDGIISLLIDVLQQWARREGRSALVTRNFGCRWDPEEDWVGIDPDVVLIEPSPPEPMRLDMLRIWEPGHVPPRVAVEVVDQAIVPTRPPEGYLDAVARCGRLGVGELWIFDPMYLGPTSSGGPFRLQIWRNSGPSGSEMTRVYAADGPAYSEELSAWLVVTDGKRLRLAEDAAGTKLWPTEVEAIVQRGEAAQQRAEASRREAEQAQMPHLTAQRRLCRAAGWRYGRRCRI